MLAKKRGGDFRFPRGRKTRETREIAYPHIHARRCARDVRVCTLHCCAQYHFRRSSANLTVRIIPTCDDDHHESRRDMQSERRSEFERTLDRRSCKFAQVERGRADVPFLTKESPGQVQSQVTIFIRANLRNRA